ncbi:diaminopimelate decarboxylase [Nonomuraea aridisoli]|uniref:Diaminopimelate decarboxylase n=1 Tax=Nonomuraea aridisoli TaxID=2070368 RepID=A0A2W2EJ79_9ACTN|nr:diaminopimelate decarboxylase [Nonomuraea aridisoli]PZG16845.1 diaminopimelate decarboxylase [Nonomuraea aridisoli]
MSEPLPPGGPWSATTRFEPVARTGGVPLADLAERFGTPAYVLDEADVRQRCRAYRSALPGARVVYAAKAFLCRAMAAWIREEGLGLDVCSGGELAIARSVGFPADRIVFHGNAKSPGELRQAVECGVGRVVVDNLAEITRIAGLVPPGGRQKVLLRVIPDVEAGAHPAVRTGGEGQKFGLSVATGDAAAAVARVLRQPELELAGLHCHLGSQIRTPEPYEEAAHVMVEQLARVRDTYGVVLPELDLGGGQGIAYLEGEYFLTPADFAVRVVKAVEERAAALGLPVPRLIVEPGRSVSGPAGLTLYRVVAVKRALTRTFVAVDGRMSDNPRPSLYGARYTARLVGRRSGMPDRPVTLVGHHCEAGDVLADDVPLPADVRPGDVLAVPATGAYHHSMASTYNLTGRPPVVAVHDGTARLIVRREEIDDLLRRDVGL